MSRQYAENHLGLPLPLWRALTTDTYNPSGDHSVSQLIVPPQVRWLEQRHDHKIVHNPLRNSYSLKGKAFHAFMEQFADEDTMIFEERFQEEIDGYQISGQPDLLILAGGVLWDYKECSVYVMSYGAKAEWEQQMNCYAELIRRRGYEVKELKIAAHFRDWSAVRQAHTKGYPDDPFAVFELEMWERFECEAFMQSRIALHEESRNLPDEELPPCSSEERWQRNAWAVIKKGGKRATKNFEDYKEAKKFLATLDDQYEIQPRPGETIRCTYFCSTGMAGFCTQYNAEREAAQEKSNE